MELNSDDDALTPRMRLGKRIRRLREQRGLTQRQLAQALDNLPFSYIGRVERGEQLPSRELLNKLESFFKTDGMLFELWELARDTNLVPDYSREVVDKEGEAKRIQVFNSSLIPALLQTGEYAGDLFRRSVAGATTEHLTDLLELRMRRQRILNRPEPPFYWAIMDEAALKRPIGGIKCMIEQLHYLLHAASKPRITVQILPFGAGAYPMLGGSLTLHTLQNGKVIGGVESFSDGKAVESTERIVELMEYFQVACSLALSADDSLDLIHEYVKEYRDENTS